MMFLRRNVIISALLFFLCNSPAFAGGGKGGASRAGGQAASHMSAQGLENTNAQWSADPDRGWVRADERHELHEQRHKPSVSKDNPGRHKGRTDQNNHQGKNY